MTGLFVPDPEYDAKPLSDLVDLVFDESASPAHRLAATVNLGYRARQDPSLVQIVEKVAVSKETLSVRFLHLTSLAHIAVLGLAYCDTLEAKAAARKATLAFSQHDREHMMWLLKSADLAP